MNITDKYIAPMYNEVAFRRRLLPDPPEGYEWWDRVHPPEQDGDKWNITVSFELRQIRPRAYPHIDE